MYLLSEISAQIIFYTFISTINFQQKIVNDMLVLLLSFPLISMCVFNVCFIPILKFSEENFQMDCSNINFRSVLLQKFFFVE